MSCDGAVSICGTTEKLQVTRAESYMWQRLKRLCYMTENCMWHDDEKLHVARCEKLAD